MQRLLQISYFLSLIGIAIQPAPLRAQVSQLPANEADQAYYDARYREAEAAYRQELEEGYEPRLQFNLGDALYQQGKHEEALAEFEDASATAEDARLRSDAYFNAGNSWMELDSLDAAINAFKSAIRNNPNDKEARYNLAVAQRMKEQQMQKQQQQQNQQNRDQQQEQQEKQEQEQQNQQSGEDQQSSSQDQQQEGEQQSPPESSQGEDQQSSGQSKPEQQEAEKQRGQTGQPQRPGVTQQEARRLLRIMEKEEQKTIERQRQRSAPARKPEKDW